jgi:hypothetical protein
MLAAPMLLHPSCSNQNPICQLLTSVFLVIACAWIASGFSFAAAAGVVSANVDPQIGIDSPACGADIPCKSITYVVHIINASNIFLAAGIFKEPTIFIRNVMSMVISGVVSSTIFSCSDSSRTGAAFSIFNSTVTIMGVTFHQCANPNSNGGAVSANRSSLSVVQCRFVNCSAASGGAMSVTGPGSGLFLHVHSSDFEGNSAIGGASGCPQEAAQPCSTWGGAIAAFEMQNVTISGCTMVSNNARASIPHISPQHNFSKNAMAGGGCVSVLFFGSFSHTAVRVFGNRFVQCGVAVSANDNVAVGNGMIDLIGRAFSSFCLNEFTICLMHVCRVRWSVVRALWPVLRLAAAGCVACEG